MERMKTEQSEAPATMSPTLAEVLKSWRQQTAYSRPSDWIFASSRLKGRIIFGALVQRGLWITPFVITAGVLLAGALIWAFLIDPERSVVGACADWQAKKSFSLGPE